jgi:hypothetical protein
MGTGVRESKTASGENVSIPPFPSRFFSFPVISFENSFVKAVEGGCNNALLSRIADVTRSLLCDTDVHFRLRFGLTILSSHNKKGIITLL